MPYFLLTFGDASRPPVGVVIIEATSMFRARMTAVERRLAPGAWSAVRRRSQAFTRNAGDDPPEEIGRMMSGAEATELIRRLVQVRRRPRP